jgi:glycosyltransferase involved in cell wall biosynthesis
MRIAIVNVQVPFIWGGAEMLASALADQMREHGHQVEIVRLPFRWYPPAKLLEHMLVARLTRVSGVDRVIGFKFPAYLVPHEDKVMWVLHQHRQAYDLWGSELEDIHDTPEGRSIRRAVFEADTRFLSEASRLFAISRVTADRMRSYNGLEAEVLYPPLPSPELYRGGEAGDYLFFPSRIAWNKRQTLAVEAMLHVRSAVRLVIAGQPDAPWALEALHRVSSDPRLEGRVEVLAGWMPEERKLELLANCLAVVFPPLDEDFGYVTLEAFAARKPVITCSDSGGPLELLQDGISGLIAEPNPFALAAAIDELASDRGRTAAMGDNGHQRLDALDISWDRVVRELTK